MFKSPNLRSPDGVGISVDIGWAFPVPAAPAISKTCCELCLNQFSHL